MFASMVLGTLLATLITEKLGRRIPVVIFNIPVLIHWFMLYYGQNKYVFMVARLLAGIGFGGILPMIYMATAECSSPKMRGFNLAIITTGTTAIGATVGWNLAMLLDWRTAALIGTAPTVISVIIPLFCVESPPWLASKGRFDECEAAFTSLHGLQPSAQKELQLILEVEKSKLSNSDKNTNTVSLIIRRLKVAASKRYFWNLMLLTNIITIYKMITGRILFGTYGMIILQKMTGQSDILPYTLAISGINIVGSWFTSYILKKVNVRSLLFPAGILNSLLLIGLSICLYVIPESYDNSLLVWTKVMLYIIHLSIVQVVLFPILEALPSELYPLEIRGACSTIVAFIGTVFIFVILKVTPAMFELLDTYGVFTTNAVAMLIFLLYLWIKLPETKGRTLHDIELNLKNEKCVFKDDNMSPELTKELI